MLVEKIQDNVSLLYNLNKGDIMIKSSQPRCVSHVSAHCLNCCRQGACPREPLIA